MFVLLITTQALVVSTTHNKISSPHITSYHLYLAMNYVCACYERTQMRLGTPVDCRGLWI